MWSFLLRKDRWKWDKANGLPSKKVLQQQRQVLRGKNAELKEQLLEHITELADRDPEFQSTFCNGKITADVCSSFLLDPSVVVKLAAAEALSVLCMMHPANCEATISAHQADRQGAQRATLPYALKLVQSYGGNISLAAAAARLLTTLTLHRPTPVLQLLQQTGNLNGILTVLRAASAASLVGNVPDARCSQLLGLLCQLLELVGAVAARGGQAVCEALLDRTRAQEVLLGLAEAHRGQRQLGPDGEDVQHATVVGEALNLLAVMLNLAQLHKRKLPTLGEEAMMRLVRMLRDQGLPWSVRLNGVTVLQAVVASPTIRAEFLAARGLDSVFAMIEAYVSGRQTPLPMGSPGGAFATPQRATATNAPPASPAGSLYSTPGAATPGTLSRDRSRPGLEPEPRGVVIVEQLLGLVNVVAFSADGGAALQDGRLAVLMAAFKGGIANFRAGGYRMAAAAAQVLYSLSRSDNAPLSPQLAAPTVTGPLAGLVERGEEYADASDPMQAQVLHGAWCAAGLLTEVMDAERLRGHELEVATSSPLRFAVRLLGASAPALLTLVGVVKASPQTLAAAAASGLKQMAAELEAASTALLRLLLQLAADSGGRQALQQLAAPAAVRKMLQWSKTESCAKRFLHLMGELEAEYQPFQGYGSGPLLAQLLASQGINPAPFQARGVDAHILLDLSDEYLRRPLGLDEVAVKRVYDIRAAYDMFAAMDAGDGRIDGCVSAADVDKYLKETASLRPDAAVDVREALFKKLNVTDSEPICFMQFVYAYPNLTGDLKAFMPPAKRRRLMDSRAAVADGL